MAKQQGKKVRKGDVSPIVKVFFTLGVLAIILFIGLFIYARINFSASAVMDEYVESFMRKSPSRIFHTLNLQTSTFITSENLDTLLVNKADYQKITAYSLVKVEETSERCRYRVSYMVGRLTSDFVQELTLKKYDDRFMGIFDRWYIDSSDLVAYNVTVRVPLGASIYVDGIRLPEDKLRKKSDNAQDYALGDMFIGKHELEVELDGFNSYKNTFTLEPQNYYDEPVYTVTPSQFKPDEGSQDVVKKLVSKIVPIYYNDLLQRRSFDFFTSEVAVELPSYESMRKQYELMKEVHIETPTHLMYVDFHSFKSKVASTLSTDNCYALRVDTTVKYTSGATVVHDEESSLKTLSDEISLRSIFHYSNGQWWLNESDMFGKFINYVKE